jgi:hypothetical protein
LEHRSIAEHRTMNELVRHHERYADMRETVRDADLLLFRRRNWYTRLIEIAGRSKYVHAAMAGWWKDRLMCVEMTAGGGRAELLSNLVNRWPGVCDVYSVVAKPPRFSRGKTLAAMIAITGKPYGWLNLARTSLLHLPVIRFMVHLDDYDIEKSGFAPYCSQAISSAMRTGGVDPVPNLADRLTEPGDLARSAIYQYRCTLV